MLRTLGVSLVGCAFLLSSCLCGPGSEQTDAGAAGAADAGGAKGSDAGRDAGVVEHADAGFSDGGAVSDAGQASDAGAVSDAGVTENADSGVMSGEGVDAGRSSDAGAARVDGGPLFDAMSTLPGLELPMTLGSDFNNDHHLDGYLVQSNGVKSATVVVAVATGPGTYAVTFDAGFTSSNVTIFDVDTDGILDLVVKDQQPGWTEYHRGDGLGHFTFQGRWYNASSLLDVTGDGVPESVEIVGASSSPGAVYISRTFADGGVSPSYSRYTLGTGWGLIADFNADHIPDYVSVGDYLAFTRQFQIFLGQADGGIASSSSAVTCQNCNSGHVTLGDMNNDSRPDVIALTGSAVTVWTVGADGSLTAGPSIARAGSRILAAYVADMDGDGRADIVAQEESDGVRIYYSRQAGLEASDDYLLTEQGTIRGVTDVNYDGRPDVVLRDNFYAEGRAGTEVLRLPARSFSMASSDSWGWYDMNGDGLRDGVSWLAFQDQMSIAPMGPRRRFGSATQCPVAPRRTNESRGFFDLDGDGFADQYSFNALGLEVSRGQGMCAFDARTTWLPAPAYGTWLDVNGDRRLDLAGTDGTVRLQLDAGVFGPPISTGLPANATFFSADWSGDGHADIVLLSSDETHLTFGQGNGAGTFVLGSPLSLPAGGVMEFARVDADGDGDFDVLISMSDPFTQQSRVDLWRQVSPGSFVVEPSYLPAACSYWTNLHVADLDLDGTPEVVASCQVMTQVWSVGAVPRFRQKLMFFSTQAVFDTDGDGDLDLVSSRGVAMNLTR